jgi:asparaginyl-tRNA synthetase
MQGHTPEFLRDIVHLRSRGALGAAVLRVRDTCARAVQAHLQSQGYLWVHTPILTSNDCEGAGELFQVMPASELEDERKKRSANGVASSTSASSSSSSSLSSPSPSSSSAFFPRPTYLTVSGQLHAEAFATAVSKVYTFGPTFRAENSNTPRHLAEFWMLEPELAPGTAADARSLAEGCVRAALRAVLEERADDVDFFTARVDKEARQRIEGILKSGEGNGSGAGSSSSFAHISYSRAVDVLQRSGATFKFPVKWGEGLASEHERYLAETYVKGPLFITDYPAAIKPFYMRANDEGPDSSGSGSGSGSGSTAGPTVQAFDLVVPRIGELVGGSAREERFDVLAQRMLALNLLSPVVASSVAAAARSGSLLPPLGPPADPDNGYLDWYLDTRRYGSLPHAGFGMGFERLILLITGVENIRDVIPVPRVPGSCRM